MSLPLVIECGDHSYAPYSFVCTHLIENPNLNWIPMDVNDGREVEHDWICDECFEIHMDEDSIQDIVEVLVPICINCVRRLRNELGDDTDL